MARCVCCGLVDLWLAKRCNLNRDATVGGKVELFPTSHLHLQRLNLLRVNMRVFNSNLGLPSVSDTIDTPQNIQLDAVHEVSGLARVTTSISYRRRQFVEEKANTLQSNHSPRGFSSALWRLPTEILSQIFLCCLPEDEDEYLSPTRNQPPVVLTLICRRWREIAMDMPSLWCGKLRLEVGHHDWQKRAFCYDSYLRRSRRPFQLQLQFHERHQLIKLQRLIQPYIDRITSLSLGSFSGRHSLMPIAAFHALEDLTIYTDGFDPMLVIAYSLLRLPRTLRRLKIVDLLFTLEILSDFIAHSTWAHLTHLEIMVEGLEAFTHLLRICPALSSLKMIGLFTAFEASETFTHTGLQSLHISGHWLLDSIGDTGLFDAITLPNLRTVEAHNIGSWPHEEFKALLTRSKCPMESLIFGGNVMTTEAQQAEYATLFPSLALVVADAVWPDLLFST
ncbi:hypothetical protein EDB19DRAFT_1760423 [Suillus lakei]|nr:hypothetical protein EDB19DRAFT_1760423 [Suillus lakei]